MRGRKDDIINQQIFKKEIMHAITLSAQPERYQRNQHLAAHINRIHLQDWQVLCDEVLPVDIPN